MLNISILWKDSNLGYILQVALENEGCIAPTVRDAVYCFHHGCIEYLHKAALVTIPVGRSINTAPSLVRTSRTSRTSISVLTR